MEFFSMLLIYGHQGKKPKKEFISQFQPSKKKKSKNIDLF